MPMMTVAAAPLVIRPSALMPMMTIVAGLLSLSYRYMRLWLSRPFSALDGRFGMSSLVVSKKTD